MEDKQKVYHVIVSPSANGRMYDHFEFLARVSEEAAYRLLDGLLADIQSLASMPFRNPAYNRPYLPSGKYRYMLSNKRYRIVYQIDGNNIWIDDIQDCRQDDDKSIIR